MTNSHGWCLKPLDRKRVEQLVRDWFELYDKEYAVVGMLSQPEGLVFELKDSGLGAPKLYLNKNMWFEEVLFQELYNWTFKSGSFY